MAEVNTSDGLGSVLKAPKHKVVQRRQESARPDERKKGNNAFSQKKRKRQNQPSDTEEQSAETKGKKIDIQA